MSILAGLMFGLGIAYQRFQRARRDVIAEKVKLRDARRTRTDEFGRLVVAAGWVLAVLLVVGTLALIAGGQQ